MPIDGARLRFLTREFRYLPAGPAVYILWNEGAPLRLGIVTSGQTLRDALNTHHATDRPPRSPLPTHFSFELVQDPASRALKVRQILAARGITLPEYP